MLSDLIVYQVVQAHEGKVWARSKPGQGSEFVIRLRRLAAGSATDHTGKLSSAVIEMKARAAAVGAEEGAHG